MYKITSNSAQYLKALLAVPKAMQKVTAATLTDTAKAVEVRSLRNLKKTMIVRTAYTTKSLKTWKASENKPIARQNAVTGTISDYLPVQDKGGRIKARKKVIAVPTNTVRGKDRRKRVPGKYKIDEMGARAFVLRPSRSGAPRIRHGKPVPHVLTRPALFIRVGKRGKLVKARDLGGKGYKLKARNWHTEAVKKYGNYAYMSQVFARNARRLLRGQD